MIKTRTICFLSFVSFVFCLSSLYAGDDMAVKALTSPMVGVNKFTQIVEVGDFLGVLDKSSLQSKGRDICRTFMTSNAVEGSECLKALDACEIANRSGLRTALNNTSYSSSCSYIPATTKVLGHWACPADSWRDIVSDIASMTEFSLGNRVEAACDPTSSASQENIVFYGLHDSAQPDLKIEGERICNLRKSNDPSNVACQEAIDKCVRHNQPFIIAAIQNSSAPQPCLEKSSNPLPYWSCPYDRWQEIIRAVRGNMHGAIETEVYNACAYPASSDSVPISADLAKKSPKKGIPDPSSAASAPPVSSGSDSAKSAELPAGDGKEGTGGLKPDESASSTSSGPNNKLININSATTSCSMHPFAVSNLWSFLPFFMLMLVFGMKRKNK